MRLWATLGRKARVARSLALEALTLLHEEGPRAAARLGMAAARSTLGGHRKAPKVNPIDQEFGTDTAADAKLHGLDIESRNVRYAVYYRATNLPILREVLKALEIRPGTYTFIDCGPGKGLVLLEAAAYPFKKVIGVEFARELHEIARRNVERYPPFLLRARIELVCEDAFAFEPPAGNLVMYFYEPFEPPLVQKMIARIGRLSGHREVLVAHVWSTNRRISSRRFWDGAPFLWKAAEGNGWTIYRCLREVLPSPR